MIYNFVIALYISAVHLAALFNKKVAKMVKGEKEAFAVLKKQIDPQAKYLWFHAASLGEFEQGRPLIEQIRKQYPQYKILQTFFSPSGYEVRKDYKGADVVCYLPLDSPRNVKRFIDLAHPYMAFFIKYEFWCNYLSELKRRNIPVYSVSSIFRPQQIFFRWYGGSYKNVLKCFDHLFVQNEESVRLLESIGVTRTTVVGDTRFDRVLEICSQAKELPLVESFKGNNRKTFVAGSSWAPDEDIFIPYFNEHPEMKLIIAPHVIDESHLQEIIDKYMPAKLKGKPDKKQLEGIKEELSSCYVCDRIANDMHHFMATVFVEWAKGEEFRKLYNEQPFICLKHYSFIMSAATGKGGISSKLLPDFYAETAALTKNYLVSLKADITHFCSMFDYRSQGQDWGTSKDSIERSIAFLTGTD